MRIRCSDANLHAALTAVFPPGREGLVFVAGCDFRDWRGAEDELAEAFADAQAAVAVNSPVIFIVETEALLGRGEPLSSAVADGLLAGARSIAFERRRFGGYGSVVAVGSDVDPEQVADAIACLMISKGSNGQPFVLGDQHLGAALP